MIKFILKFLSIERLINILCDLIRDKIASKTETKLDDIAVDQYLRPIMQEWGIYLMNPTKEMLSNSIKITFIGLLNFADDEVIEEFKLRLEEKQND